MNTDLPLNLGKNEFLAWVQTRERKRFELVEGVVVEAEPHTLGHARIVTKLLVVLDRALGRRGWHILLSFGVETGPRTIRDPDLLVDRGGRAKDVLANAPILIAEVLSPHSVSVDLDQKPSEYLSLPSVHAYLVLSQDEPKAWLWTRGANLLEGPGVISGADQRIVIPSLALDLALAAIYRGGV